MIDHILDVKSKIWIFLKFLLKVSYPENLKEAKLDLQIQNWGLTLLASKNMVLDFSAPAQVGVYVVKIHNFGLQLCWNAKYVRVHCFRMCYHKMEWLGPIFTTFQKLLPHPYLLTTSSSHAFFIFEFVGNMTDWKSLIPLRPDLTKNSISKELKHISTNCKKHWKAYLILV